MNSHRTHTIQLGPHTLTLKLPITQRQRMTVYGEYLDAHARLGAALKGARGPDGEGAAPAPTEGGGSAELAYLNWRVSVRDLWQLGVLVEAGAAMALVRMLPDGHELRAEYEARAYASAPDPALACGDALIERLAEDGVPGSAVNTAVGALMGLGDAGPTQAQVDVAVGNSGATPS
jgi:hypothetical protein